MDKPSLRFEDLLENIKSEDSYTRHDAVQMLGEIGDPRAVQILVGLLKDEDVVIREGAINSLINISGKDVAAAVVNYLRDSNSPSLRNTAVEILTRLGSYSTPVLLPLLKDDDDDILIFVIDIIGRIFAAGDNKKIVSEIIPLLNHKNPNIRASAAKTLGLMKDEMAKKPLLDLLNKEDEEWVKFCIIEAVGEIAPSGVTDTLLDIIRKEQGVIVDAAIDAIGKIITTAKDADRAMIAMEGMLKQGIKPPIDVVVNIIEKFDGEIINRAWKDTFTEFFINALKEGDRENQHAALTGLGVLREKKAVPDILKFAAGVKDDDEDMLAVIKNTLVKIGDAGELITSLKGDLKNLMVIIGAIEEIGKVETVDTLKDLLSKVDRSARRAIVSTLKSVAPQASIETLIVSLKDSDSHVRGLAAAALGEAGDAKVVPYLFDALITEKYKDIQEVIVDALIHYQTDDVIDNFYSLLFNENQDVKKLAIRGLGAIQKPQVIPFIIRMFEDEDAAVRKEAIKALHGFKEKSAVSAIISTLSDDDDDVRFVAVESLEGHCGNEVVKALLKALHDKSMWVRYKACILIGNLKEKKAQEDLIGLLKEDENAVKIAAASALGKIGDKGAVSALSILINDPDQYVREAALRAIEMIKAGNE